jgi:hypothetical protein
MSNGKTQPRTGKGDMRQSEQIAEGFERGQRMRARTLRRISFTEGMQSAAFILEGLISENKDADDTELMQGVRAWIKETKEFGNDQG